MPPSTKFQFAPQRDFMRPLGSLSSVTLYQESLRPLTLPACLAIDPRSPQFVNPDLYAALIEKMQRAISKGDVQEAQRNEEVLQTLSMCIKKKRKRFQRFTTQQCRSTISTNTLEDGSIPSFFTLAPTEEVFRNLLPATQLQMANSEHHVCETGGWIEQDQRTVLHLAAEKNFPEPLLEILDNVNASLIPDVDAIYMDVKQVGSSKKWSYVQAVGRTALHDACRSGCARCVEGLISKKASANASFTVTMFPSWWDPVFHPWMLDFLSKSSKHNQHKYKSIWNVQPVHVAVSHHCGECLEVLMKGEMSKQLMESKLLLGSQTSSLYNSDDPEEAAKLV
eukprot:Skav236470  [mRNA]  locus=scaffold3359:38557:45200:+ [translate_table: standard]